MRPIGLNILTDGAESVNETELLTTLRNLRPYACVLDTFKAYKAVRDDLSAPVRLPILRIINRDDAEWHKKQSPDEWIAMMRPVMDDGAVVLQCLNEPAGFEDLKPLAAWIAEVVRKVPSHVTLVVGNFGVGNPDEARILTGGFDAALHALAGTRHYLGVHEYFVQSALDERYHHISRFRAFDQRTDALGLSRLNIVVTEIGRDVGGGQGRAGDGWKNSGLSPEQYVAQIKTAVRDVYTARRPTVPVCVFSYGSGFAVSGNDGKDLGRAWESFDVRGNEYILHQFEVLNAELNAPTGMLPPTPTPAPEWTARHIKTNAAGAYFRKEPATTTGYWSKLQGGKIIDVKYNVVADIKEGINTWRQYEIAGQVGWIRSDAAELLPEPVIPPPVIVEPPGGTTPVTFTVDELKAVSSSLQALYDRNAALIAHAEAALADLRAANTAIGGLRLLFAGAADRAKATTKVAA